ncbi:hypothetical protein BHM03_00047537 [Ensete ventricosum]|uniref:Uncharacterized protein n=1 Tax=Ensete ventricosum TaxID=4639 RepID=A0A445MLA9_ENSVE|nr:hypothetical protein BHM03_00047537 [Ensete ventricosum]
MTVCVPQRRSHGRGPLGGPSLPSPLVPFKIPHRPTHTHRRGVAWRRYACRRWRRKQGHRNFQKVKAVAGDLHHVTMSVTVLDNTHLSELQLQGQLRLCSPIRRKRRGKGKAVTTTLSSERSNN